jgi:hypothetical protein
MYYPHSMGVRIEGNQLVKSNTVIHMVLHTFGQKRNDDLHTLQIADTFSLRGGSTNFLKS